MNPDVDTIQIAFSENSLTTLKIIIGAILFGIALDTKLNDFRVAFRQPKAMLSILAIHSLYRQTTTLFPLKPM